LAAVRLLRRLVLTDLGKALLLPQRLALALVEDLDVYGDLHLTLGHVGAALAGLKRDRHVGVVASPPSPPHRVGVAPAGRPQPEAALERLEDRVVDVLGERRLRRLVVERQNRDGLDVRQAAAGEAVDARREREGEGASDGRARWRDRTSPQIGRAHV